jgi:hypothetical protein
VISGIWWKRRESEQEVIACGIDSSADMGRMENIADVLRSGRPAETGQG